MYKLVSVFKWTGEINSCLIESNDLNVIKSKMNLLNKYLKYCKNLSPSKKSHKHSNNGVINKIIKEIHLINKPYIHTLLQPNVLCVVDEKGNILSNHNFLVCKGGLVPHDYEINVKYIEESNNVKELFKDKWQKIVDEKFEYFEIQQIKIK